MKLCYCSVKQEMALVMVIIVLNDDNCWHFETYDNIVYTFDANVGAHRGFGDLGRMAICFQGASEHW